MDKPEIKPRKLNPKDTKQEMIDAYNQLLAQTKERQETQVKPEQKIEQKQTREAVEVADALSTEGIGKEIGNLRSEIGTMLVQLSDKLDEEISKYQRVKRAVESKESELQEIFEIQKNAGSLAALIEAQQQKREQFEAEMGEKREALREEIESTRSEWQGEKVNHELEIKERAAQEKKSRERDTEEFRYQMDREQRLAREQFEYDKQKLEREIGSKREEMERDLKERERAVAVKEAELAELRQRVEAFPKELQSAADRAVKQETDRVRAEAKSREELMKKEYEGEQKVLASRIEALQQTAKEQAARIAALSGQLEKSYGQVQDIAVKAIESSSTARGMVTFRQVEPSGRQPQGEKE